MLEKDKQLLLKDICERIPYGVKCTTKANGRKAVYSIRGCVDGRIFLDCPEEFEGDDEWLVQNIVPDFRPMSSMTKDEKREFQNILSDKHGVWLEHSEVYDEKWEISVDSYYPFIPLEGFTNGFNWLVKKMFDYRGLISLGLALPAPEGMYNGQNN